jgi:RNA polymerase sigma-70 factor (ECF subfamily)
MTDGRALVPVVGSAARAQALSDDELLTLASSGGVEAREELARRHRTSAYLLALQLLGNRDDALDVAQEAMLHFFASLGRIAPGRAVRPWLLAIVRNQARDFWRRRRVRRAESIEADPDALLSQMVDAGPDPEESVRRAELRRRVWRAMAALSADHREIVVLRDYHGLSYHELAQTLGIRIGTVMSRLHAARQRLRTRLTEEGFHA